MIGNERIPCWNMADVLVVATEEATIMSDMDRCLCRQHAEQFCADGGFKVLGKIEKILGIPCQWGRKQ